MCLGGHGPPLQQGARIPRLNFGDARIRPWVYLSFMKSSNFRIIPLSTEIAEAARRAVTAGAADHALITASSPESSPCRHCLRWAQPGERVVLFPYAAIPSGHAYSETGPIFVHAEKCERYSATDEYPAEFRNGRAFRAYDSKYNLIDAQVVDGSAPETVI